MYLKMSGKKNLIIYMIVLPFLCIPTCLCVHFEYEGEYGPENWGQFYPECDGKRQSPIEISTESAVDRLYLPLRFAEFDKSAIRSLLMNNGHTVILNLEFDKTPTISGGPLTGNYAFEQLHFHWGENLSEGSEHVINGIRFPLELHMVFYNKIASNFEDALNKRLGVVVLACTFQISDEINTDFEVLTAMLDYIQDPGTEMPLLNTPKLGDFISNDRVNYITYEGSLTTPRCNEIVRWIIFLDPIPISAAQVEQFRLLRNYKGEQITRNFRPTQLLNRRIVYRNNILLIGNNNNVFRYKSSDVDELLQNNTVVEINNKYETDEEVGSSAKTQFGSVVSNLVLPITTLIGTLLVNRINRMKIVNECFLS